MSELCGHGVALIGRDERCVECEIEWEVEMLEIAERSVSRHTDRLRRLKGERTKLIAVVSRQCGAA